MHIRTKGRFAGLAFLAATGLMAEAAPTAPPTLPRVPDTAPAEAMQSLDLFFAHALDDRGNSRPGTGLKVVIQSLDGRSEALWLASFARGPDGFSGILADSPAAVPGDRGDSVAFTRDAIRDWHLTSADGRIHGAFTTRGALARMTPEQARALRDSLAPSPLPAGWQQDATANFRRPS